MTYPLYRFPIVQLREWDYQDLFEIMMIYLHLSEQDVASRIRFLSEISEVAPWKPLAIAHDFLVFNIHSPTETITRDVAAQVEGFQNSAGFQVFSSMFGGYWIGAPCRRFAEKPLL